MLAQKKTHQVRSLPTRLLVFLAVSALTGLSLAGAPANKKPKPSSTDQLPLSQIVKAIQDALDEAAKHPVEGFPRLQSVSVAAQTTITKDASGQIKLFVFNIGGEKTVQNLASMTFELKPPPESAQKLAPSSVKPEDIRNALARQIESAKLGFVDVRQTGTTSLKTDKVEIQIGFEITKSVSGGPDVSFTLISAAEVSLTGKLTHDSNNTITLTFAND